MDQLAGALQSIYASPVGIGLHMFWNGGITGGACFTATGEINPKSKHSLCSSYSNDHLQTVYNMCASHVKLKLHY